MTGGLVPSVVNHRGSTLPVALGLVVAAAGAVGALAVFAWLDVPTAGATATIGCALVFGAGFVDDRAPGGPRGLRGHLRELGRLHVTTGIVKLLVITASAVVVAASLPSRSALADVVLMAGCANLWNGLDVRPGRALKAFLPVAASLLVAGVSFELVPPLPGVVVGAAAVVWADLRERAVLGDGGSNLLGFVAGLGLVLVLPGWGVWVAAGCAVVLNVLADTVTLSRIIEGTPPLRWYDSLGRIPPER